MPADAQIMVEDLLEDRTAAADLRLVHANTAAFAADTHSTTASILQNPKKKSNKSCFSQCAMVNTAFQ